MTLLAFTFEIGWRALAGIFMGGMWLAACVAMIFPKHRSEVTISNPQAQNLLRTLSDRAEAAKRHETQ